MTGSPFSCKPLLLLGLLAFVPVVRLAGQDAPASEIKWRLDYNNARKEALEKGLPLVIDFGTQSCFWCKKLDETTLRDAKIVGIVNERFIPLKIDAERQPALVSDLRIGSFPTIVIAGPDGSILYAKEGYQNRETFTETLQRSLGKMTPPEWVQRDLQLAQKWIQSGEYPRAISALKLILEDGKARAAEPSVQKMLDEMERKAAERLAQARQLQESGNQAQALDALSEIIRSFSGLRAANEASVLLTQIVQSPQIRDQQRSKRAGELLAQAREFYKSKDYIPCLDRCEILLAGFGDLQEGQEGSLLVTEIKSNPEWLQSAAEAMSDRLCGIYLALADALLKKGQPQRAEFYLLRVIQGFPGSRQAESAQIRLGQLQGTPSPSAGVQSARP